MSTLSLLPGTHDASNVDTMTTELPPADRAAEWRGDELFQRPDWQWTLSSSHQQELLEAVRRADSLTLDEITPSRFSLPTLAPLLSRVQAALESGAGAVRIDGFPLESLSAQQQEAGFWGIANHLGTPVSQSAAGERIFHVRDEGHAADAPAARGPNTSRRLSFHTDRCDVIGFLCLRPAQRGGDNQIVSSAALFRELARRRPDLLAVLMQPFYYQRHSVDPGHPKPFIQQPVFSIHQGRFAANLLRVLIERAYQQPEIPAMTAAQREALDELEALAESPELHVNLRLERGDILLLNNFVTFHRRSAFEDHHDPQLKRHLLRIWLSVPNSRPLAPDFRDNYGAVDAGALRGGMTPLERD